MNKSQLNLIITWFMLALLGYNMGGYFLFIKLSEEINRNEIREFLFETNNTNIQLIKVTDLGSVIRNRANEIIIDGKRYDVKSEFSKDGISYFYCIHDKYEDNLYTVLHNSVSKNSESQGDKHSRQTANLLKSFFNDWIDVSFIHEINFSLINFTHLSENLFFLLHYYLNVTTPPPKRVFC